MTPARKRLQILTLIQESYDTKMAFNKKFMALRDAKRAAVAEIRKRNARLKEIAAKLNEPVSALAVTEVAWHGCACCHYRVISYYSCTSIFVRALLFTPAQHAAPSLSPSFPPYRSHCTSPRWPWWRSPRAAST